MKVYFIHPNLTLGSNPQAETFFNVCFNEMEEHIVVTNVRSATVMLSIEVTTEDYVVFFNKTGQDYSEDFLTFIDSSVSTNAKIYPIALNGDCRVPPSSCNKAQSFDVVEALRQRKLTEANITTVAYSLSRIIISRMQPTISKEDMQIFISHRRLDGEDLAALFYCEFRSRAENAFRDLIDIKVGQDAQEIIEDKLKNSDVVVFIDTPKSGESYWIGRELSIALSLNLPIIWVKVGDLENRAELKVKPADKPHFTISDDEIGEISDNPGLFDEIIHKAFRISRDSAKHVFDQLHVLKEITKNNGLLLKKLDTKNMIYKIEIPRTGYRYYQKPLIQLIQCYGRRPKEDEHSRMLPLIEELGFVNHPEHGPYCDTAIILSPINDSEVNNQNYLVTESFSSYISNLENFIDPKTHSPHDKRGIIISGAFPDCEPDFQQCLTDAVYSLTQTIFQRQGTVIFGAHPTFQHLIIDMGKIYRKDDFHDAIHLYVSKFFATKGMINELKKHATVKDTDTVDDNRNKSLTLMRECMISDNEAIALICLGGKTKAEGNQPGVDEEIAIARSKGIPVFLLGSVGGRSAELAKQHNEAGWTDKLNDLSIEENIELMTSIDYKSISLKILNSLGL